MSVCLACLVATTDRLKCPLAKVRPITIVDNERIDILRLKRHVVIPNQCLPNYVATKGYVITRDPCTCVPCQTVTPSLDT